MCAPAATRPSRGTHRRSSIFCPRPVSDYVTALAAAGFLVEALREVAMVHRAQGRLPAFLHVRAVKAQG
jgi:hypothetical protein